MSEKKIFVADIGGTNSRFAWFTESKGVLEKKEHIRFKTKTVQSFAELFSKLQQSGFQTDIKIKDKVVIAAAGPVQNQKICFLTNIDWNINLDTVPQLAHGTVINDFVAQAFACLACRQNGTFDTIQTGKEKHGSPIAVIGAGTGLGHCTLIPANGKYLPVASEAGSTLFPFWGETELAFAQFLIEQGETIPPRSDSVVSGRGLQFVHNFLNKNNIKLQDFIKELTPNSPTTALFSRFYGRVCRQYALAVLPGQGLFLSGGIVSKNPFIPKHENFLAEFIHCPKHTIFLQNLPISILTADEPGLLGAAFYAVQNLKEQ